MNSRYKTIGTEALLELISETIRTELMSDLPADKRYLGAMISNAVDIARRGLDEAYDTAQWELLDKLYDDGEGTLRQLARDIRGGSVSTASHSDLAQRLTRLLIAELTVSNPRFLVSRGVKS